MALPATDALPALFRTGDIGVSSEWRDMSYDWAHILTKDGVAIYTYLRDTFDHQRSLRPFILTPDGPTKTKLQHVLGYKTSWPMDGPEYLLQIAGLLHVEIGYGQSRDPERPQRTRVAYYTVGRLDHPVLDWSMLDRLLNALMIALDSPSADPTIAKQQKKAQAAVRSLGQAGMLQDCDPDDLFYEYGAWPTLLPTLICDERWVALFAHLHGQEAVQRYRRQARAWVEWVQRNNGRLAEENRQIANQLLAAQRRGPRNGGESGPPSSLALATEPAVSPDTNSDSDSSCTQMGVTSDKVSGKAVGMNQAPFVTGESPTSHQAVQLTRIASVTTATNPDEERTDRDSLKHRLESLAANQLTSRCWEREQITNTGVTESNLAGRERMGDSSPKGTAADSNPLVEPHLRDAELTTTRHDGYFWCAIQSILYGTTERYSYTAGEKQAAHRRFKQQGIPVGVVLAALRAVMTLQPAQRPARFADALKSEVFHACVQQALSLLPTRAQAAEPADTWSTFLRAYRSVGLAGQLRDVSTTDYHALYGLFSKQPDECWEVLSRVERAAQAPDLSPAYFARAITNNQRAAAQAALVDGDPTCRRLRRAAVVSPRPATAVTLPRDADLRVALLEREGLKQQLLTDDMTEAYICAWIDEADARSAKIRERAAWIAWGISSGYLPTEHPKLPPRESAATIPSEVAAKLRGTQPGRSDGSTQVVHKGNLSKLTASTGDVPTVNGEAQTWAVVLGELQKRLPQSEFDTWIRETALVELAGTDAIVAAPHIFARDMLENTYGPLITSSLCHVLGFPVQLQVVIG